MKKKALMLLLAASLTFGYGLNVSAAETQETTIQESKQADTFSITLNEIGSVTHTYNVYQVLAGTFSTNEKGQSVLADIAWGSSVQNGSITVGNPAATFTDAQAFSKFLADNASDIENYRDDIFKALQNPVTSVKTNENGEKQVVISGLQAGYYLIADVTNKDDLGQDTYSNYMIQVVGNVDVTTKTGTVTHEKKVDDINDSTGEEEKLQDTADYDIGDHVPFTLTGTVPANIGNYKEFKYIFTDQMDQGLTYDENSMKVSVINNGEETVIANGFTLTVNNDGHGFELAFADLKTVAGVKANSTIKVTYTATLNENCVKGQMGNKNESYITYSNNPNVDGTGETEHDNNIVFTYIVDVNKVDENNQPLAGAEFEIYKYVLGTGFVKTDLQVKENQTTFEVTGIDDGIYKLVETKAPTGYNKLTESLYFIVSADHAFEGFITENNITEILKKLVATEAVKYENDSFGEIISPEKMTLHFSTTSDNSAVATDVVNNSGSILPSTGGVGTTIFYIVGFSMIVGAGVVLFTRKRLSKEEM